MSVEPKIGRSKRASQGSSVWTANIRLSFLQCTTEPNETLINLNGLLEIAAAQVNNPLSGKQINKIHTQDKSKCIHFRRVWRAFLLHRMPRKTLLRQPEGSNGGRREWNEICESVRFSRSKIDISREGREHRQRRRRRVCCSVWQQSERRFCELVCVSVSICQCVKRVKYGKSLILPAFGSLRRACGNLLEISSPKAR